MKQTPVLSFSWRYTVRLLRRVGELPVSADARSGTSPWRVALAQRIEEVGLILVAVDAARQPVLSVFFDDAGVMAGSDIVGSQIHGLVQKFAEFDFTVAHDIGVRRSPSFIFIEEIGKYFIEVFLLEIDGIVGNVESLAHAAHVFSVSFSCAVAKLIGIIPVFHKDADHFIALLFEQERCYGGVDSSRHADNDTSVMFFFDIVITIFILNCAHGGILTYWNKVHTFHFVHSG